MLRDDIQNLINKALKEGDKERLSVLRYLLSQIKYKEIDKKENLGNEEVIALLRKEAKKRKEELEIFDKSGRHDLSDKCRYEIKTISEFLPAALSDQELEGIIDKIAADFEQIKNPGMIIKKVIEETKGKAEPSQIAALVNKKFNKK